MIPARPSPPSRNAGVGRQRSRARPRWTRRRRARLRRDRAGDDLGERLREVGRVRMLGGRTWISPRPSAGRSIRLISSSMRRYARSVSPMMRGLVRSSGTIFATWRSLPAGGRVDAAAALRRRRRHVRAADVEELVDAFSTSALRTSSESARRPDRRRIRRRSPSRIVIVRLMFRSRVRDDDEVAGAVHRDVSLRRLAEDAGRVRHRCDRGGGCA